MSFAGIHLRGLTQSEYVWLVMTVNPFVASRRKGVCYFEVPLPEGVMRLSDKMMELGLVPFTVGVTFPKPK
jgi:hypothetical protein